MRYRNLSSLSLSTIATCLLSSACGGPLEPRAEPDVEAQAEEALFGGCDYTVRGKIKVDHQLTMLSNAYGTSPLENIKVKVSGKEKVLGIWGWYASWGEVRTDSDGSFELDKSKSCNDHRIKIEVKFDDDDLEVRHETATWSATKVKWYQVYEMTSSTWDGGTRDIGTKTFQSGGSQELGDDEPRAHADIWVLYKDVIGWINALGSVRDFTGQVKVKYPHNSALVSDSVESSYANPLTNVIYIFEDQFTTGTLVHELMHIWAYQHSRGEDALAVELLEDGSTHGLVDESFVAFHEGFAEYGKDKMLELLYASDVEMPYSREKLGSGISGDPLTNLALLQRHDMGWWSVFNALTLPQIYDYDFLDPYTGVVTSTYVVEDPVSRFVKTCSAPSVDFADVLRAFESKSSAGYGNDIHTSEMTVEDFLQRFADIVSGFTSTDADQYKTYVDPANDTQPEADYCERREITMVPAHTRF